MKSAVKWAYGSGATPIGIVDSVPGLLLLYFMTERLRLDPAISGGLIFAVRCAGLVIDPLVGRKWDQNPSWRQRRWLGLMCAYGVLALSYVVLFTLPQSLAPVFQYYVIAMALAMLTVATSVIVVLHVGMAGEGVLNSTLRESLIAARSGGLFAGLLVGGSIAPTIVETSLLGIDGWKTNAIVMLCLILTTAIPASLISRSWQENSRSIASDQPLSIRLFLKPSLAALMATNLFQVLGLAIAFGAIPYIITSGEAAVSLGLFIAVLVTAAAISVLGWQKASARIGLAGSFGAAGLVFAAAFALGGSYKDDAQLAVLAAVLCGAGLGGIQFSSYALLVSTLDSVANGNPSTALIGIWTSGERATLALGPLLVGLVLSVFGKAEAMTSLSVGLTSAFMVASLFTLRIFVRAQQSMVSQEVMK
jgi:glycoside/pentoside/hexuronide:cation symporter, GPH family